MAAVNRKTEERIDLLLRWLIATWEELSNGEYEAREPDMKEDYLIDDIPMAERLQLELAGYLNNGDLSEQQLEEYRKLQDLIAQNTPKLELLVG